MPADGTHRDEVADEKPTGFLRCHSPSDDEDPAMATLRTNFALGLRTTGRRRLVLQPGESSDQDDEEIVRCARKRQLSGPASIAVEEPDRSSPSIAEDEETEEEEDEPVVADVAILVTDHNNNVMGGDEALEVQPMEEVHPMDEDEDEESDADRGSVGSGDIVPWGAPLSRHIRNVEAVDDEDDDDFVDAVAAGRFGAIGQERGGEAARRRQEREDRERAAPVVLVQLPETTTDGSQERRRPSPSFGFTLLRAIWQVKALTDSPDQLSAMTRLLVAVEEERSRLRTTARARHPVAMGFCQSVFALEVADDQNKWDQNVGPHYKDFMTVQTRAEDAWSVASRGLSDEPLLALSSQFALSELSELRLTLANRRAKVEAAVASYQADWESVMAKVAIMSPNLYYEHPNVFPPVPTLDAMLEEGQIGRDGFPLYESAYGEEEDEEYLSDEDEEDVLAPSDDPRFAAQLADHLEWDFYESDHGEDGYERGVA